MEIMAEDWVRLELGMHLQIGVLRYKWSNILLLPPPKEFFYISMVFQPIVSCYSKHIFLVELQNVGPEKLP